MAAYFRQAAREGARSPDQPCSAADVLAGHVLFEIEAIDRMYLNIILRPGVSRGCDLRRPVADGVLDGTFAA